MLRAPATSTRTVRRIPGARHDSRNDRWTLPLSWATCVAARGVFGDELEVGPALAAWAQEEYAGRIGPALSIRGAEDSGGRSDLYPFQRADVSFLDAAESALVASQMGTGKTVVSVAAIDQPEDYPALIVTTNSMKRDWEAAFARWAPGARVRVAGSGTANAQRAVDEVANGLADVLVLNWESLRSLSRLAPYGSIRLEPCENCDPLSKRRPALCQREDKVLNLVRWGAVVADEAHRAKDPKAAQTRALWAIGDRAGRRIALTGTPIADSAADLWSIMRFVSPEEYPVRGGVAQNGQESGFLGRYAQHTPNFFSGGMDVTGIREDRRDELNKFFLPRFIRRLKRDVLPDLPPKVYERRYVRLTGRQKKAYDDLESTMVAEVGGGTIFAENALTAALRLRMLASAYGTVVTTDGDDPDQQVILSEPSSKLDAFEEVVEELGDQQAVVFAESAQLINLAAARLDESGVAYGLVTGAVPPDVRARVVEQFQSGQLPLLLATVAAGGEGITLTAASVAIFLQRPWSAVLNAQAEDRLHRIGQDAESVLYIDLVTEGTIDEDVFDALRRKAEALEDVVQDGRTA